MFILLLGLRPTVCYFIFISLLFYSIAMQPGTRISFGINKVLSYLILSCLNKGYYLSKTLSTIQFLCFLTQIAIQNLYNLLHLYSLHASSLTSLTWNRMPNSDHQLVSHTDLLNLNWLIFSMIFQSIRELRSLHPLSRLTRLVKSFEKTRSVLAKHTIASIDTTVSKMNLYIQYIHLNT